MPLTERHPLKAASAVCRRIRLNAKTTLNLTVKPQPPTTTKLREPQDGSVRGNFSTSSRDMPDVGRRTELANVNGSDMTSTNLALGLAEAGNDSSITFVPCGYLRCTQCYDFAVHGNASVINPRPSGYLTSTDPTDSDSDVAASLSESSSDESESSTATYKGSDCESGSPKHEGERGGDGGCSDSELTDLTEMGEDGPCSIGKVVEGNLIDAVGDRGDHEDDAMDVDSDEDGGGSDYTLGAGSSPSSSDDEYAPTQATKRKAVARRRKRSAAAPQKKRSGYRR